MLHIIGMLEMIFGLEILINYLKKNNIYKTEHIET